MRAIFILFLGIFFSINSAFSYELVLPKEKKSSVKTNYVFFVGKAKKSEEISINDDKIYVAPNGAFAHSVKLKHGENRIIVKSNFNTQIYKFYKPKDESQVETEFVEMVPRIYEVKKDNTPLRKTPEDFGMNRISHLFEGTNLVIDGKKGDFYRVFLAKNKEAWIAKDAVILSSKEVNPKFITMNSKTFKNASTHTIEFTEKLPYTIDETDSEIVFKVYNPIVSENSIYTVNIKRPNKYKYETVSHNGVYVFKVSELEYYNNTLEGFNIVVDAGHGGAEKGAIGCLGDSEKDINLKIALELAERLRLMGANVILTRDSDINVSLEDRVKLAKKNCSNLFVSVHLNSIPDVKFENHKHRGTSVYYYNPNSKDLAYYVKESVTSVLNTRDDGVRTASFAVLRPTDYIGILVEVAYMTNPSDSMLYTKENFSTETAKAIADGILNYASCK